MPPRSRRQRNRPDSSSVVGNQQGKSETEDELEVDLDGLDDFDHPDTASLDGLLASDAPPTDTGALSHDESGRRSGSSVSRSGSSVSRGGSSRLSARRSGRGSAKKSSKRSARRAPTPEELAARRRSRRMVLSTFLILLLVVGGGFGIYYGLIYEEVGETQVDTHEPRTLLGSRVQRARSALAQAETELRALRNALDARELSEAERRRADGVLLTEVDVLGGGQATFDPQDPVVAGPEFVARADRLRQAFNDIEVQIQRLRDEVAVEANLAALARRIDVIRDEPDLAVLERDVEAFRANPVAPADGADPALARRYSSHIERLRTQGITRERERRQHEATTGVVVEADAATQPLIRERSFAAAFQLLQQREEEHRQADLRPVRQKVQQSLQADWDDVRTRVETLVSESRNAALSSERRQAARQEADRLLQTVIERYGREVPETRRLVEDAERMRRDLSR